MKHSLSGYAKTRIVYLDGEYLDPKESQDLWNHSPDGFNWGYHGSGPAQLALAILIKLDRENCIDNHQKFKRDIIAGLAAGEDFDITFEY